jgi:hypothetical protein
MRRAERYISRMGGFDQQELAAMLRLTAMAAGCEVAAERRELLGHGLAALIGADAWLWVLARQGRTRSELAGGEIEAEATRVRARLRRLGGGLPAPPLSGQRGDTLALECGIELALLAHEGTSYSAVGFYRLRARGEPDFADGVGSGANVLV